MSEIASQEAMRVIDRTNQCIRLLLKDGLPFKALQRPLDDPEMRKRLVNFWKSGGYETAIDENAAKLIGIPVLGTNSFPIEPSYGDLVRLHKFLPFSIEEIRKNKDTHILMALLPCSIWDMDHKIHRSLIKIDQGPWSNLKMCTRNKFIWNDEATANWKLIQKHVVPGSLGKPWEKQKLMVRDDEEILSAREAVYAMVACHRKTGNSLFGGTTFIRCPVFDHDEETVIVGYGSRFSKPHLIFLERGSAYSSHLSIGIAVCKKPQKQD